MKSSNVLLLPGWYNSGPEHWQSRWEEKYGYQRVQQHDWDRPLRGDWLTQLEETVLRCDEPAVLVAHSLGCILAAAWAATSRNASRVKGALLVAPGDAESEELRDQLPSWSPIERKPMPFPSILLSCHDDPYCAFERSQGFAEAWGSRFMDYGSRGHINAESNLGDWAEGHELLETLMRL